ncbi:MAG: hypothetical protein LBI06_02410 [Treponema sp.]|jgi:hypothetical protein|nr:hypothetical protein [Treponema sp.]
MSKIDKTHLPPFPAPRSPLHLTLFVIAAIIATTSCTSSAEVVNLMWYEGTWHHEDGEIRLIIAGTDWTLVSLGKNDEKGIISFNESTQTFSIKSTHYWDKDINNWEPHNQDTMTASYTISGNKWTVNGRSKTWDDLKGVWVRQ